MRTALNIISKTFRNLAYAAGIVGVCILPGISAVGGEVKRVIPLKKVLNISVNEGGRLIATVTYNNVSDFDVFVLRHPPTVFVESHGVEISEIGPSEKRKAYTLDDYIRLAPKDQMSGRIDMTDLYAWKSGTQAYEGSISGNYTDPADGRTWKGDRVTAQFHWRK